MSAVAGIYNIDKEPISNEYVGNVMKELEKFPFDDVQVWQNYNIFLGCLNQWITHESVNEKLPFYDSERQLAITADAVIDNRKELFELLSIDKAKRKLITDSELILLSYCKWGEDVPRYLVGDFAFVIWDQVNQRLFGARDFSGSRSLYYYYDKKHFAFCTVIKPLFILPFIKRKLNEEWLSVFLAIPGIQESINSNLTAYNHIFQVPPSYSFKVEYGEIFLSRYCKLGEEEKLELKSSTEYEEAFSDVFDKAVKSQIRTRHNVGARLSGGLDSGAVVSFAAKALEKDNKQLHSFSYIPVDDFVDWTPKNRMANERTYIQEIVQYVGNIKDYYLSFQGKSPLTEINDMLDIMEMPYKFFENSYWLKGIYEKAATENIGVLLNGSRGNFTISWGPALDYYALLLKKFKLVKLLKEVNQYSANKGVNKRKVLSLIRSRAFPPREKRTEFPIIINPDFARNTRVIENLSNHDIDITGSYLYNRNAFDLRKRHFEQNASWNINGTSKSKLSLKYSVLDRDPTNDIRVIKFCLSLPAEQFVQNGVDRALVRRVTKGILPDKVRMNQKIRGIQGADGLHRMMNSWGEFIEEIEILVKDPLAEHYLDSEVLLDALLKIKHEPRSDYIYDYNFKILMRSLIVYRFLKTFN